MTIHCRTSMVLAAGNLGLPCALAAVTRAIAKTTIRRNPIQRCMTSTPKTGWLAQRDALNLCQPGSAQLAREQARTRIQREFAMCLVENRSSANAMLRVMDCNVESELRDLSMPTGMCVEGTTLVVPRGV